MSGEQNSDLSVSVNACMKYFYKHVFGGHTQLLKETYGI